MRRVLSEETVAAAMTEVGFDANEASDWYQKFRGHRKSASARGIQSTLSFDQYLSLAKEAGLTSSEQIGKQGRQHVLGRVGDIGSYEVGNCRFITSVQNRQELHENGGLQSHYASMRGSTKASNESVRRMAKSLSGRTKETHAGPAAVSKARAKEFVLFDPEGGMHFGKNLFEFCKTNELSQPSMSLVCHGHQKSYKGWTGYHEPDFSAHFHEEE